MVLYNFELEEVAKYHVFKEKQHKFNQKHLDAVIDLLEVQLKELRGTSATQHKIICLYEFSLFLYNLKGK